MKSLLKKIILCIAGAAGGIVAGHLVALAIFTFLIAAGLGAGFCMNHLSAEFDPQEFCAPHDPAPPSVNCKKDGRFRPETGEMIRRGNMIVAALKEFYKENGHYPKRLGELAPKYIKKIPKSPQYDAWNMFFLLTLDLDTAMTGYRYDIERANPLVDTRGARPKEIQNFSLRHRHYDDEYFYMPKANAWNYHEH